MNIYSGKFVKITVIVGIALLITASFSPIIFTRSWSQIDFSETGQIGDTIGGLTAPILASLGAFLTFIAFYIQFDANKIQINHIKLIRKKEQIDSFENKIFSMLNLHRKNVDELLLESNTLEIKIKGQELISFILDQMEEVYKALSRTNNLDDRLNTELSYLHIFYGKSLEDNQHLIDFYNNHFNHEINLQDGLINYEDWYYEERYSKYGYGSILSRYLRFQYQIVQYIDNYTFDQNDFTVNEVEAIKYRFAKIYRSQLTNNEQLLLYINSITPLGKDWNSNGYIRKYKLIKNIILPMVFCYSPKSWARSELNLNDYEINDFFEFKDKI